MNTEIIEYNKAVIDGHIPACKWIYGAALRFQDRLDKPDQFTMDWEEVSSAISFMESLKLVGEFHGEPLILQPWQKWSVANIFGWKTKTNHRMTKLAILQVARGAGKTTLASAMLLYEMTRKDGNRTYSIANNLQQAGLVFDTMKEMVEQMPEDNEWGFSNHFHNIARKGHECTYEPLAALERSLDGLNPSFWVADEAAEFKGRYLSKLLTTGAKRREITGLIVTTPGENPESQYRELVEQSFDILNGETGDDTFWPMLYGLDVEDDIGDELRWIKANPGLGIQPAVESLQRAYNTMKRTPLGRKEFERYHCSREVSSSSGWLDMMLWGSMQDPSITLESLKGKTAWVGLDLSKSRDMSSISIVIPLDNGKIFVDGFFYWPSETARDRELDYRYPIRQWVEDNSLQICPGRDIDYTSIIAKLKWICENFDVREVGFDQWGSKFFAESAYNAGIPMRTYSMGIATLGPGSQILQQNWYNQRLVFSTNPIFRNAFGDVAVKQDQNGNLRPVKSRTYCCIDPVISTLIALHISGCGEGSIYNIEASNRRKLA